VSVELRTRRDDDLPALEELAAAVRETDGYPNDDPAFFHSPLMLRAWVVVDEQGGIVGHGALHSASASEMMAMASDATGRPVEQLAAVSRMLVAAPARRRGIGARLLTAAVSEAHARGLWPVLDTGAMFDAAIALYEAHGFQRVGPVSFPYLHAGETFMTDSLVYVGPPPPGD